MCSWPVATPTAPAIPGTVEGVDRSGRGGPVSRFGITPWPSWPPSSLPQHVTVESTITAHTWTSPTAICLKPDPMTVTGVVVSAVAPLPSCPL